MDGMFGGYGFQTKPATSQIAHLTLESVYARVVHSCRPLNLQARLLVDGPATCYHGDAAHARTVCTRPSPPPP